MHPRRWGRRRQPARISPGSPQRVFPLMSLASPILITGGAGFIGSHTCLVLLEAGHSLVVLDNCSNSSPASLERVAGLAGLSESSSRDRESTRLNSSHSSVSRMPSSA